MKKIYQYLFIMVLCLAAFNAKAQTQYDIEHALVCWDSAGVETTLIAKFFYVVGRSDEAVRKVYIHPITNTVVVPTIGAVAGGVGSLSSDVCGSRSRIDTVIVKLDSILDDMQQDPDTCNCLYSIDIENTAFNTTNNLQQVTWSGESVVTRNCGYGNEEISRSPFIQLQTIKKRDWYSNNGGNNLQDGLGFFRQVRWHLANPTGDVLIDLNPSTVLTTYPNITSSFPSFDANDLIFDAAATNDMKTAVENVIEYALSLYAASNNLSIPSYEDYIVINSNGTFRVGFAITHNPSGHYAGIDRTAGNQIFEYSSDGANTVSGGSAIQASQGLAAVNYQTSCGQISISYFSPIIDTGVTEWKTLTLVSPSLSLITSTTQTCTEACTSIDNGCISICDTVLVEVVEDCLVQQKFGQEYIDGANPYKSFSVGTFNSVSLTVVTGVITVGMTDDTGTMIYLPYTSNFSFSLTADECKLNGNDILFIGAAGSGIINWKY